MLGEIFFSRKGRRAAKNFILKYIENQDKKSISEVKKYAMLGQVTRKGDPLFFLKGSLHSPRPSPRFLHFAKQAKGKTVSAT